MSLRHAATVDAAARALEAQDVVELAMDQDAFRGFYDRTARALLTYLHRLTGDAATAALNLADLALSVGGSPEGGGAGFQGLLSEVRVYNTALTQAEQQSLAAQLGRKYGIAAVPEPGSLALMLAGGAGLLGIVGLGRRRRAA